MHLRALRNHTLTPAAAFSKHPKKKERHDKKITKVLAIAALAAGFAAYGSADTIWDLDATFGYDSLTNTATGTFELNSSLDLVTYDITVSGTNTPADNVYTPGNSFPVFPDLTHLDFYDFPTNQNINLYLSSPLSNAGGTIELLYGDGGQTNNSFAPGAGRLFPAP